VINLLEKLLNLLQFQGFAPLGFSQQYESQQHIADKVFMPKNAGAVISLLSRGGSTKSFARQMD